MYALLTEFGDGDNVVTTLLEHNSNYVPWHGLCREILPRLGRRVECRLARLDPVTGEPDLGHLASLIDARTKLVCCTGASSFLGTRPDLAMVRALADASGYRQPNGERRSYLLVDGAQLVPGSFVDVRALDADFLAFSFHKLLAPFGVGVLYGKQHLLEGMLPFLYGGDMIAEGEVFPDKVGYNGPPWPTTHSASTRPPAAGSASTSTTPRRRSTRPLPPWPPSPAATASPRPPGTGAARGRPGTARPVRRFGSSHPAVVLKESAMPADGARPADGGAVRQPQSVSQAHEAGSVPASAEEQRAARGRGDHC
jgi:Aminotransferase class-V